MLTKGQIALIKKQMERKNMTQQQLAAHTKMTPNTISRIVNGRNCELLSLALVLMALGLEFRIHLPVKKAPKK